MDTPELKEYLIFKDDDGTDGFTVKATSIDDAAHKALAKLGWWVRAAEPE